MKSLRPGIFYKLDFCNRNSAIQIFYLFKWALVICVIHEIIHSSNLSNLKTKLCSLLSFVLYYPFNIYRTHSDVTSFSFDINNLCFLSFCSWSICPEVYLTFIDHCKESAFGFNDFLYYLCFLLDLFML